MIEFQKQLPENPTNEDFDDRIRALMLEKAAMLKLVATPGWAAYVRLVQTNAEALRRSLEMNAFDGMKAVFMDQFVKGVADGLTRSLQLVEASTVAYDEEIKRTVSLQEKLNGDNSERSERDAGSNGHDAEPELPGFDSGTFISAP